jgi:Spy/CpxP family protein refolding chaperone
MKRFSRTLILAASAAALFSLPLAAQDRPSFTMADRMERHGGGLLRCLKDLDLSDSQKSDIKGILDAAKPALKADAEAIRGAHQKLDADFDAGAGVSVLGQDYINVRAAVKQLKADASTVKDQVFAKLTTDQQNKAQSCLDARKSKAAGLGFERLGD